MELGLALGKPELIDQDPSSLPEPDQVNPQMALEAVAGSKGDRSRTARNPVMPTRFFTVILMTPMHIKHLQR